MSSLWSSSGSSLKKAGALAFSLIWPFQRRATGAGGPGAVDDGQASSRGAAPASWPGSAPSAHSGPSMVVVRLELRRGGRRRRAACSWHSPAASSVASSGIESEPTAARGWPPPGTTTSGRPSRLGERAEAAAGGHAHGRAAARRAPAPRTRAPPRSGPSSSTTITSVSGPTHSGRRVAAHHGRRDRQAGQAREDEVGADGRAAHAAHDEPGRARPAGWPGSVPKNAPASRARAYS